MRVYLPATVTELADEHGLPARTGRAVTDSLWAVVTDRDEESAEYVALVLAAADSLDRLTPEDPPRRVVAAADVPGASVQVIGSEPGRVEVPAVGWDRVVSFHVDEDTPAVRAAIERVPSGGQRARAGLDDLDLLWYDVTERTLL